MVDGCKAIDHDACESITWANLLQQVHMSFYAYLSVMVLTILWGALMEWYENSERLQVGSKGTVEVQDESQSPAPQLAEDERIFKFKMQGRFASRVAKRLVTPAAREGSKGGVHRQLVDAMDLVASCVMVVNWVRKTYVRRVTAASTAADVVAGFVAFVSFVDDYSVTGISTFFSARALIDFVTVAPLLLDRQASFHADGRGTWLTLSCLPGRERGATLANFKPLLSRSFSTRFG